MREILFKAKRLDNGEWVVGYLCKHPSSVQVGECSPWYIQVPPVDPDDSGGIYNICPETICQHTGLTDKNGKKIFEGDILLHDGCIYFKGKVVFDEEAPQFVVRSDEFEAISFYIGKQIEDDYEVIGNIHDDANCA